MLKKTGQEVFDVEVDLTKQSLAVKKPCFNPDNTNLVTELRVSLTSIRKRVEWKCPVGSFKDENSSLVGGRYELVFFAVDSSTWGCSTTSASTAAWPHASPFNETLTRWWIKATQHTHAQLFFRGGGGGYCVDNAGTNDIGTINLRYQKMTTSAYFLQTRQTRNENKKRDLH